MAHNTMYKKERSYRVPSPILQTGKHLGQQLLLLNDVSEFVTKTLLGQTAGCHGADAGALGRANAVQ